MDTISKYEHRKVRKVLVERKRRDRIEKCLEQLKTLIFGIQQQQQHQQQQLASKCNNAWIDAKLEKAELLELTVEQVYRFRRDASSQMSVGFLTCMHEVQQFLQHETGCDTGMHTQLLRMLHRSVVKLGQGHDFEGHGVEYRNEGRGFRGNHQGHGFEGHPYQCASEGVDQRQRQFSLFGHMQEERCSSQRYDSLSVQTGHDSEPAGRPRPHMRALNSTSSSLHSRPYRGHPYISPAVVKSLLPRETITPINSFEAQASLPCLRTSSSSSSYSTSSSSSSSLKPEVVEKTAFRCNEISSTTASGHVMTEIEASAIVGNDNETLPVNSQRNDGSDVAMTKDAVWRPW